jgi:parallel beta-helix repeat protein
LNGLSGFLLNGVQNCALTGQQASKNGAHGFYLLSMSRSTVTGCSAIDNGWTGGTRIPDAELAYDGFFLEPPADGIVFSGYC